MREFNYLIGKLTDDEFWEYVKVSFDEQYILDIMNNWCSETKKEEIKKLKKIIKNRK